MKASRCWLSLLLLLLTQRVTFAAAADPAAAAPVPAAAATPAPGAGGTWTDARRAAQSDLQASLQQLARVRETIGAEKIPLTRELNTLEDQLADLRRQADQASRLVDVRNLDLANLKNELKLRQEELAYLANLLDEYARGLEARVHVSELPRYAPLIQTALLAQQNKDLPAREKFATQLALAKASLARLDDLVGGTRFPGVAVNPQGVVDQGQFALIGPIALFAADQGDTVGLALSQAGSTRAAVRPLDKKLRVGLASIVGTGRGLLALDATLGGAIKELIGRGSLVGYFKKGGPIMWPLLLVSILTVTVISDRLLFLHREQRHRDPEALLQLMAHVENGDVNAAIAAGHGTQDVVARSLVYALQHREKSLSNALMRATGNELVRYQRGISLLDTIVTLAPLLGLLGTVTGMMGSFGMLGGAELSAPAQITGGIAEALIATCFGLGIAIFTLIPLNYLHTRAEEARHDIEDAATHLELLMKPIFDRETLHHQHLLAKLSPAALDLGRGPARVEP